MRRGMPGYRRYQNLVKPGYPLGNLLLSVGVTLVLIQAIARPKPRVWKIPRRMRCATGLLMLITSLVCSPLTTAVAARSMATCQLIANR